MTAWRLLAALLLAGMVGVPVTLPFLELSRSPSAWHVWQDWPRLASPAGNTLALVACTLVMVLPVGVLGAILLYRTDLPCRRALRLLTLISLFVPLPVLISAWQAVAGSDGWLSAIAARFSSEFSAPWTPWNRGLGSAIALHAIAGLPWVIILVGQGLRWIEPHLEEDALLVVSPWRVLRHVTLPRCRAAILAASLWVTLMTVTEITVTDMMQVRTYAEEVYTQFVLGDEGAQARAVAVSLPAAAVAALLVWRASQAWERDLPAIDRLERPSLVLRLGAARWPCLALALTGVAVFVGLPLVSLVWKTGAVGYPPTCSLTVVMRHLNIAAHVRGLLVIKSLMVALFTGTLTATLALVLGWLVLGVGWMQAVLLSLMAVVWALPGPVLGIGLKDTIASLVDLAPSSPLAEALYFRPSPLPALWAQTIRFLPFGLAIVWPVLRVLPRELFDAARIEGLRPRQELWHVVLPLARAAYLRAILAVAILSLGELSASKLVATPGWYTFAHEVFDLMHYGVTNDLAALGLLLLGLVVAGGGLVAATSRRWLSD
jgi:iron(III) transport system permease protein